MKNRNKVYRYDYPENRTVNKMLQFGDRSLIAKKTGYSYIYVCQVLNGQRNNSQIIDFAKKVIDKRKELLDF